MFRSIAALSHKKFNGFLLKYHMPFYINLAIYLPNYSSLPVGINDSYKYILKGTFVETNLSTARRHIYVYAGSKM